MIPPLESFHIHCSRHLLQSSLLVVAHCTSTSASPPPPCSSTVTIAIAINTNLILKTALQEVNTSQCKSHSLGTQQAYRTIYQTTEILLSGGRREAFINILYYAREATDFSRVEAISIWHCTFQIYLICLHHRLANLTVEGLTSFPIKSYR